MSVALDEGLVLARGGARPIYQQIKDLIVAKIEAGEWAAGARMPSEHEWVAQLGVSRMTVNRALRELARDGHIERVHGVGTFVAHPVTHASLIELRNIADEVRASGAQHRARVVRQREETAVERVARRMEIEPGARVLRVTLVHYRDDTPIQIEDRYVSPGAAPDFLAQDFTALTPTEYLVGLFRPDEMEHVVQATLPDADTARRLAIGRREPCLRLTRRTWKDARVVTCVTLTYPGSRYDLVARYSTRP